MKKVIGLIISLLSLAFISILILRIWDVYIVSLENIIKSSVTLVVLGSAIVFFIIIYGFLFRSNKDKYDHSSGKRAHPKL